MHKKYLEAEVLKFEKNFGELGWAKFKLREETKSHVLNHLSVQMATYNVGDVNLKRWWSNCQVTIIFATTSFDLHDCIKASAFSAEF